MIFRRALFLLIVLAVPAGSFLLVSRDSGTRSLRIGLVGAPGQVWVLAAERLARRLEEETNGELILTVYPSSQLGRDSEMLQQLEIGVLDMHLGALRSLTTRDSTLNAWFTPYLLPDAATAARAAQTPAAGEMLERMQRFGMIGVAYTFGGYRHVLMRDGRFARAADLQNKKVRISNFPAARTWYQALGAAPMPVPLGETYHALQMGVLDGIDIDLDALSNLEFQRIASDLTLTGHMMYPGVFLFSKVVWEEDISAENREILARLIEEAADWANEEQARVDARLLAELREQIRVTELEDPQEEFHEAIVAWEQEYGDEPLVVEFQNQVRQLADPFGGS